MLKRVFKKQYYYHLLMSSNYSITKLIKTICSNLNIMTPEKKLCQIKRLDRDSNLQSQKVQLLLKPIVDKKVRFIK